MEDAPEYRSHGARLVARHEAHWRGVRAELITREADGPCEAAMCVREHVVSLRCEGDRAGFLNRIADGPWRRVGGDPGWIRVLPAGRPVRSRWERGRRTYLMAFVDPSWLRALAGGPAAPLPREQLDLRDEGLRRVLEDMRRELQVPGPCSAALGDALATELAVLLLRDALPTSGLPPVARGGLSPRSLRAVLALVEARADGRLTLREMAQAAGVGVHHFSHAFRESTGVPPHRYVLDRRLAAARALLDNPALSLTEVASRAGFGGSSQFATAFRRTHGMSPSAWRRRF